MLICRLKKVYILLDSLHGPKDTDLDMLDELSKTGLAHQIVLTKLDRAPATVWTELSAALKYNPQKGTVFKSATRILPGQTPERDFEELQMGVWAGLRGNLALGCDETVLGVSSEERWGISGLRYSILMACGAFRRGNYGDQEYLRALQETPVVQEREMGKEDMLEEEEFDGDEWREGDEGKGKRDRRIKMVGDPESKLEDDNPMRGKVFGGKEMLRKKIYRW